MRKLYTAFAATSFCTLLASGFILPSQAKAGPLIEFGDEGYLQLDVKLQGILENTDFGSGEDGQSDRTDLYLRHQNSPYPRQPRRLFRASHP
ncbi:MAG: hypothetical protein LC633_03655 [Desulfobulbaceae bacterium]|nr:hypothetical protein [Desulfobulbaceae bacterium]